MYLVSFVISVKSSQSEFNLDRYKLRASNGSWKVYTILFGQRTRSSSLYRHFILQYPSRVNITEHVLRTTCFSGLRHIVIATCKSNPSIPKAVSTPARLCTPRPGRRKAVGGPGGAPCNARLARGDDPQTRDMGDHKVRKYRNRVSEATLPDRSFSSIISACTGQSRLAIIYCFAAWQGLSLRYVLGTTALAPSTAHCVSKMADSYTPTTALT